MIDQIDCILKIQKSIEILEKEVEKYNSSPHWKDCYIRPFSKNQYEYLLENIKLLQNLIDAITGPDIRVVFSVSMANYLHYMGNEILKRFPSYKAYIFANSEKLRCDMDIFNEQKKMLSPGDFLMWETMNGAGLLQVDDPRELKK